MLDFRCCLLISSGRILSHAVCWLSGGACLLNAGLKRESSCTLFSILSQLAVPEPAAFTTEGRADADTSS